MATKTLTDFNKKYFHCLSTFARTFNTPELKEEEERTKKIFEDQGWGTNVVFNETYPLLNSISKDIHSQNPKCLQKVEVPFVRKLSLNVIWSRLKDDERDVFWGEIKQLVFTMTTTATVCTALGPKFDESLANLTNEMKQGKITNPVEVMGKLMADPEFLKIGMEFAQGNRLGMREVADGMGMTARQEATEENENENEQAAAEAVAGDEKEPQLASEMFRSWKNRRKKAGKAKNPWEMLCELGDSARSEIAAASDEKKLEAQQFTAEAMGPLLKMFQSGDSSAFMQHISDKAAQSKDEFIPKDQQEVEEMLKSFQSLSQTEGSLRQWEITKELGQREQPQTEDQKGSESLPCCSEPTISQDVSSTTTHEPSCSDGKEVRILIQTENKSMTTADSMNGDLTLDEMNLFPLPPETPKREESSKREMWREVISDISELAAVQAKALHDPLKQLAQQGEIEVEEEVEEVEEEEKAAEKEEKEVEEEGEEAEEADEEEVDEEEV